METEQKLEGLTLTESEIELLWGGDDYGPTHMAALRDFAIKLVERIDVATRLAAPMPAPQAPRMLTADEQQDLYFNAAKTPPQYAIAIQRKFCAVNGLPIPPASTKETT
jgi:hypothetical protein